MSPIEAELAERLHALRRGHDVVRFMTRLYPATELCWRELPSGILDVRASSSDFSPPEPGEPSRWHQISGDDWDAELVIYRAARDGRLHILGPARTDA